MFSLRLAAVSLAAALVLPLAAEELPPTPAMSSYVFGLLRRGPSWTAQRTPATDSIQAGHMANIQRMADQGVLLAAGPMLDRGDLRGIFIFRADSIERLRRVADEDPAIRSGRLVLDLHSWLAPSGIGEPYRRMAREPGYRDSMVRFQLALLKTGPKSARNDTKETRALQAAHVDGIFRSLASGELATAGSFRDGGELRGVMVFRGDSAYAHARARSDPAVRAGHLTVEMHPWFAAYGTMPGDTLPGGR